MANTNCSDAATAAEPDGCRSSPSAGGRARTRILANPPGSGPHRRTSERSPSLSPGPPDPVPKKNTPTTEVGSELSSWGEWLGRECQPARHLTKD